MTLAAHPLIASSADLTALTDEQLVALYDEALRELALDEESAARILDQDTADLIEQVSRIEVEYPLAAAVLWQKHDAPWDQRRLVAELVHPLLLVLGGNRSGKTYAILEALVAFALGGDHPAVKAWLEDNDLDPEMIPPGPGECYAVANSAASSIKIHRLDIAGMLPRLAHWWSMNAPQEARVDIPVPGYETPARIWFKSVDQGHRAYKGDQVRFVAISEEPEGEEGKLVLAECMRACAATGGRVVLEMTPQNGMTWVHDDLVEARQYDCRLVELDSAHNRMVQDYPSLQRWLASLTPEERRMRQHGQFVDRRGLVYTAWTRGDGDRFGVGHLVDDFAIPETWPRFMSMDWGQTTTNGTAGVWGALSDDGTLFLYREYYVDNQPSFRTHARDVRTLVPTAETFVAGWADHEQDAIDEFAQQGFRLAYADKDVSGGLSKCASRLQVVGGRPRLKVFRSLKRFVYEIEEYRRDPNKRDGAPVKKNDHVMDAWRYMENGISEWLGRRERAATARSAVSKLLEKVRR